MTRERLKLANYIDGRLRAPQGGRYLDVFEPATGQVWADAPDSDAGDVEAAVAAAKRAAPGWAAMPHDQRARVMHRLSELLEARIEQFAAAESQDTGKPLSLARSVDIPRAVANLRFFAAAITQFSSESHAMEDAGFNYTLRQPLGAVACISPWNLPLYLLTWKIAPALAAGNTVVAKPSEITPVSAWMLSQLCIEAGLQPGVLNIVHGSGPRVGAPLVAHADIKAISFTGSTRTGTGIAATAAPQLKKLSLELGGKNATIVFADCDFERCVDSAVRASFTNQGQICLCGSRILVERSLYERFRSAFVERVAKLRVGDPQDAANQLGAIVSAQQFEKVIDAIARARSEGGNVLTGGASLKPEGRCAEGWFIAPTVIDGLAACSVVNQEEIFGPVATLIPFDDENAALSMANDVAYGLAASLWTTNLARAHRVAARLQTGIVWINCWMVRDLRTPFGGVKQSGVGREGGVEALRFFTEAKNVCVALD